MKISIQILRLLLLTITVTAYGQTSLTELNQTMKQLDSSWTCAIDTVNKNKHAMLISGKSIGILKLKKNSDEVEYFVYTALNDNFFSEVENYHDLASCAQTNKTRKILNFKSYLLFLPMTPCWTSGYSEEEKRLIEKVALKLK